jgi:choline dehydrogenase-like flavoprotein
MALDYAMRRRGPMTMAPSQMGAFAKSNERHATPNVQFHVQPLALPKFGEAMYPVPGDHDQRMQPAAGQPGLVHAASPDAPRAVDPAELSGDGRAIGSTAIESIRLVRRIVDQPALKRFSPQEHAPGAT